MRKRPKRLATGTSMARSPYPRMMASATARSSTRAGSQRGMRGAVSPQYTANVGMLCSKNHSSWSSVMTTVISGRASRSVLDSSSRARSQASACARNGSSPRYFARISGEMEPSASLYDITQPCGG